MSIHFHPYDHAMDYQRVGDFLVAHFQPGNRDGNWLQPAWEYMHAHPYLDQSALGKIGIWEEADRIVAAVHYESQLGEAFFQLDPAYGLLRPELLTYAEQTLFGAAQDGQHVLRVYINDFDQPFESLVKARGYVREPQNARPMSLFMIPDPFPPIQLPEGYRLTSMDLDCDWDKIQRVLWRGFDHPGEPPALSLEERQWMQKAPNFRHDLKIMTQSPNGDFASFCGMWYEPVNRIAYVEPVATDPVYRRMGLGRVAVLEGIRRCGVLGAKLAFVGSDQLFYLALGFKKTYTSECWVKNFSLR